MKKCETCDTEMNESYRFTDWHNDSKDEYGTFEQCKELFDKAVAEDETGRYSIYDVSECPKCKYFLDEGVVFNEKCPEYEV
ncbi:MAG TPA: hypothetical protein VJ895_01265 [Candidatus Nanoarchaeia archaeon]|nr:hypothetical protein [Candidatus Nanoarchaeia archaeon]